LRKIRLWAQNPEAGEKPDFYLMMDAPRLTSINSDVHRLLAINVSSTVVIPVIPTSSNRNLPDDW
jgi:hypothetical protein